MRPLRLVRRLLPTVLAIVLTTVVVAVPALALSARRRAEDQAWCRKVTPKVASLRGRPRTIPETELRYEYNSCAAIRRSERGLLGAVWRTGGQVMAACNVEWGRFQQLSAFDRGPADAIITPYGITDALDPGSQSDKQRFINVCLQVGPHVGAAENHGTQP